MSSSALNQLRNLAREVRSTLQEDEEDQFAPAATNLVQTTARLFRRRTNVTTPRGRGRPSFRHWRARLFLLNKPMSTLKEFKRDCLDNGFGPPGSGTVSLDRRWSLPQLEDFIYQCYPQHPLQLVGFQYAKCLKGAKRELQIVNSNNVTDLASTIRAGKVYIVPNREIPATQRTNVSQHELDDEEDLPTPTVSPPHTPSPPNELEDTVPLTDSPIETVSPVISFRRQIASIAARATIREAAEQILVSDEDESSHSNDVIATTADEIAHVDVVPLAAEDNDTLHLRLDTTEENVSAQTEPGVNEGLEHLQMFLGDNKELTVRRQSILTDVIQAYEDPQLVGQRLVIRFSESSIFPILGRILTHGTALTGVFPIRLCRSSVFSIIHGTPCEDEEMLLSDLLIYLTDFERQVSKTALEDFNKLTPRMINHLTDMFIKFGVSILPKADTFRQLMVNLARSEIAIKPLFLCTQIRQGILSLHMDSFWSILTTSDLKTLYQNLNPTPQTVVDKLQRDKEDLRPQEANTLYYLKDFVYSLNSDDLVLFLVFITGSDVLPRDDIIVTFNTRSGMLRVPVAHTFGNTIELSTTYETIQDFKREFLLVLHSQEAFQMSMA
ncbi:unnamed protein product [Mytilus edulis]|uniref:HECT domain-containing protein n=1 Tax=Mytilus edulis TaxID=6550 RepID=A0A8S3T3Z1_MYTED|nr:unnamed protein product [Mytilus edulis]